MFACSDSQLPLPDIPPFWKPIVELLCGLRRDGHRVPSDHLSQDHTANSVDADKSTIIAMNKAIDFFMVLEFK